MAILTQSGRAAMAASIKTQPIHLAWGTGNDNWEDDKLETLSFEDDRLETSFTPIKALEVKSQDETVTYTQGTDYIVDSLNGQVTRLAEGSIPVGGDVVVSYVVDTPSEDNVATALINELGRRVVDETLFCVPDPDGELITPTGRFTASDVPTNNLHLRFTFDFDDSPDAVIRELGVMVNTGFVEGLPLGQRYFQGDVITDAGILLVLEHTVPLVRTAATRETFSFVVTF